MKKTIMISVVLLFTFFGCNSGPKPIAYGSDGCHFCRMTIVDKQYAAQFMTKKGRTYSFDATECMMNHLKEIDKETVAILLVNDFNAPGEFTDAKQATYLISKNLPSPMGEYLTAFSSEEAATISQTENEGEILNWTELENRFK